MDVDFHFLVKAHPFIASIQDHAVMIAIVNYALVV